MSRIEFEHGLIVGKFYPPHEGHLYLIQTALFHCRRVSVLVLGASTERLSMSLRAQWIRECFAADAVRDGGCGHAECAPHPAPRIPHPGLR